jgi:hypothetical protein
MERRGVEDTEGGRREDKTDKGGGKGEGKLGRE